MKASGLLLLLLAAAAGAEPLPEGFGSVSVDMPWSRVRSDFQLQPLDAPITAWDEHVRACGYRAARIDADNGELLVQADDFTVTAVSFISPLAPGSDLMEVAEEVLQSYGQPQRVTQRDALGRITLDRARVRFITLDYADPRPVEFTVAGPELWEYRVRVSSPQARFHLNRMLRCARERERAAR